MKKIFIFYETKLSLSNKIMNLNVNMINRYCNQEKIFQTDVQKLYLVCFVEYESVKTFLLT